MMETPIEQEFKELSQSVQELIDKRIRLFNLLLVEKIARSLYAIVFFVILVSLLSFLLVFASIAMAHWLGNLLGNIYYAYLVIAGAYLVILLIFIVLRKVILLNLITRISYNIVITDHPFEYEESK